MHLYQSHALEQDYWWALREVVPDEIVECNAIYYIFCSALKQGYLTMNN